jgi:hypothetical protein
LAVVDAGNKDENVSNSRILVNREIEKKDNLPSKTPLLGQNKKTLVNHFAPYT